MKKVNEVIYGKQELISLKNDSVAEDNLLFKETAHGASGEEVQGAIIINDEAAGIHYDNSKSGLVAENAQAALDEVADGLNTEERRAVTRENVLESVLSNEISRSQTADETISAALQVEITRATAAEGVNKAAIDVLNGSGAGSVSKAVADGIARVIDDAPESLDTLKEIADWIDGHAEDAAAMNRAISENAENLTAHENRTDNPHGVTKEQVGLSDVPNVTTNNQTPTFTQASTRANIASGERLSVIFGKIMKFFADLKTVAFTNSYTDLDNQPTIPTKTSDLKNDSGYITGVDINSQKPTYTAASSNQELTSGETISTAFGKIAKAVSSLISHIGSTSNPHKVTASQVGLGNVGNFKAVSTVANQGLTEAEKAAARANMDAGSSSANGTVTSVATGAGLTGGTITESGTIKAKLKSETLSSLTATDRSTTSNREYPVELDKDGNLAVNVPWANTTYSNASLGQGYGTCSTAAATTEKAVTLSNYALVINGVVTVKFTNAVPASATLKVNGKDAKAIYHKGAAIAAGVISAGDTATFMYNGSQYHLIALDKTSSGSGGSTEPTVGTENLTESADGYTFTHTYPDRTEVTVFAANGLSAVKTITYTSGTKYTINYTFNANGKTATIVTAKA